jgi:hypothetical protein
MESNQLVEMIAHQRAFQQSLGHEVEWMSDVERVNYARDMILATLDELHEALNEISWKPWAKNTFVNEEAMFGELVDVWHFLMNLFMVAAPKLSDVQLAIKLSEAYAKKRQINVQRQLDGYDGVSTKCPECGRAAEDAGQSRVHLGGERYAICCQVCGGIYSFAS